MAKPVGRRGETRERVLDAALALFAEHGVSGTSLQMIAARLGVTKAAVYYQFPAKEDIVLAVLEPAFAQMSDFLAEAEAETDPGRRRDVVLAGLVDLVLDHRQVSASLQGDPGVTEILHAHPRMQERRARIAALLLGDDPALASQVSVSLLGGGLMLLGADPHIRDIPREDLRPELLAAAHRLLGDAPG